MPSNRNAPPTTDSSSRIWQERTDLVKQEMAAANAAMDAKTARLKALRLEKEARDAEAAALAVKNAPRAPAKKGRNRKA